MESSVGRLSFLANGNFPDTTIIADTHLAEDFGVNVETYTGDRAIAVGKQADRWVAAAEYLAGNGGTDIRLNFRK